MSKKLFFIILTPLFLLLCGTVSAQEFSFEPKVIIDGEEGEYDAYEGSAPLVCKFVINPTNADGHKYEWYFCKEGESPKSSYLIRRDEIVEHTFMESGTHCVYAYALKTLKEDSEVVDTISPEMTPIRITVKESKLEFPNAFSPNGDGINDIYKAKEGFQSIVEFKAIIFNRWGQKLYEWTDPAGGWDGTYNGTNVKQGVYYVNVEAKGADGHVYKIRRDVNLLRGYTEKNGSVDY